MDTTIVYKRFVTIVSKVGPKGEPEYLFCSQELQIVLGKMPLGEIDPDPDKGFATQCSIGWWRDNPADARIAKCNISDIRRAILTLLPLPHLDLLLSGIPGVSDLKALYDAYVHKLEKTGLTTDSATDFPNIEVDDLGGPKRHRDYGDGSVFMWLGPLDPMDMGQPVDFQHLLDHGLFPEEWDQDIDTDD